MQVMPDTADGKKLGKGYSPERLTEDWDYNAALAGQYLADLSQRFEGNLVLVAAAYNADLIALTAGSKALAIRARRALILSNGSK